MSDMPKVLLWDIETGFNLLAKFDLWPQYSSHKMIVQERYMVCAAWKWLGEKKVHAVSVLDDPDRFKKDPTDDTVVTKALHKVLSEADVIIGHNGDKFDLRWFNGRALVHKMKPLPPRIQIDTLKIAKANFNLNSNRLDYIGDILGVGNKIKTNMDLWLGCLNGKKSSVREMVTYNKQDVILLEDVYKRLLPYAPPKLNVGLFTGIDACPKCGGDHYSKQGWRYTGVNRYQKYQCNDCGSWFQERTADKGRKPRFK